MVVYRIFAPFGEHILPLFFQVLARGVRNPDTNSSRVFSFCATVESPFKWFIKRAWFQTSR